jgi:hypothetical protein
MYAYPHTVNKCRTRISYNKNRSCMPHAGAPSLIPAHNMPVSAVYITSPNQRICEHTIRLSNVAYTGQKWRVTASVCLYGGCKDAGRSVDWRFAPRLPLVRAVLTTYLRACQPFTLFSLCVHRCMFAPDSSTECGMSFGKQGMP